MSVNTAKKEVKPKTKKLNSGRFGLAFEKRILKKCEEYNNKDLAYITKIPTEVTIIRRGYKVIDCIYRDKASLDFCGVIKGGKSIYIEAKSCQSKTSFPFSLIKDHQFTIAYDLLKYTDLVYFLIEMREINKVFLVNAKNIKDFRENKTRQSLPLDWLEENGALIDIKELDFIAPIINL